MNYGFWKTLPKPFVALAPMYDVTDTAFRQIIAQKGKPDVFYTEFVSTDGLQSEGQNKLMHHLQFDKIEQPIVAQVFGTKPENYFKTAQLVNKLGFDGFDINMGCPDKNIIKGGSCSALIHTPKLAQEIIQASQEGSGDLPVSVKIRIGDTSLEQWPQWIEHLLEANPATIAIHLRTRKEMSKVPAHWELMPEIVEFVKTHSLPDKTPIIIGNGDVATPAEAKQKAVASGCDGVMIGRGIFGNPWLFSKDNRKLSKQEKIQSLIDHVTLYDQTFNGVKPFDIMKRHFKAYIQGFDGAGEMRAEIYPLKSAEDVIGYLRTQI